MAKGLYIFSPPANQTHEEQPNHAFFRRVALTNSDPYADRLGSIALLDNFEAGLFFCRRLASAKAGAKVRVWSLLLKKTNTSRIVQVPNSVGCNFQIVPAAGRLLAYRGPDPPQAQALDMLVYPSRGAPELLCHTACIARSVMLSDALSKLARQPPPGRERSCEDESGCMRTNGVDSRCAPSTPHVPHCSIHPRRGPHQCKSARRT